VHVDVNVDGFGSNTALGIPIRTIFVDVDVVVVVDVDVDGFEDLTQRR
jgi:hypothetical protein